MIEAYLELGVKAAGWVRPPEKRLRWNTRGSVSNKYFNEFFIYIVFKKS